jgi:hypothetical protein
MVTGMIIAACIAAAGGIAQQAMKGSGRGFATPQGAGNATKKVEVPDIFGEKGAPATTPTASLAQSLQGQGTQQHFGPQGMDLYSQDEQRRKLASLLGG